MTGGVRPTGVRTYVRDLDAQRAFVNFEPSSTFLHPLFHL